eukprot:15387000-Alexandrium_andersonii.AAC.1
MASVTLRVLVVALAVVRAFVVGPWALVQYVATPLPVVLMAVFARLAKVLSEVVLALAVAAVGAAGRCGAGGWA